MSDIIIDNDIVVIVQVVGAVKKATETLKSAQVFTAEPETQEN